MLLRQNSNIISGGCVRINADQTKLGDPNLNPRQSA